LTLRKQVAILIGHALEVWRCGINWNELELNQQMN
jgi:hypothetical protein